MIEAPVPPNEKERLRALQALHILDTPPEERFDRLCRMACAAFSVDVAYVSLIAETRQWYKAGCGLGDLKENPRLTSFCGHTVFEDDTIHVPDARRDPRFCDSPYVTGPPGVRFYLGQPLRSADGHPVGTFCLLNMSEVEVDDAFLRVFTDFAHTAEAELNLLRMVRSQSTLLALKKVGLSSLDREGMLREMLRDFNEALGCTHSCLLPLEAVPSFARALYEPEEALTDPQGTVLESSVTPHLVLRSGWSMELQANTLRDEIHRQFARQLCDVMGSLERMEMALDSRKNASLGALAAGVAHQVNNPLGAVSLMMDQAQRTLSPEDPARRHLIRASESLQRAQSVVEALLAFAEASSEPHSEVELMPSLNRFVNSYQSLHPSLSLNLEWLQGTDRRIQTDEFHLHLVLRELLDNARRAHLESGSLSPVVLRVGRTGSLLSLEVIDQGGGFAKALLEQAFEPFVTTKAAGQGYGLGLALSRKLARQLGGRLKLESTPGGCRAHLTLPLKASS